MSAARSVAVRLVATAAVATVIVLGFALAPLVGPSSGGVGPGPEHPEFAAERLAPDRLESAGQADPSGDVGTVLFDRSHRNRFQPEDVAALVRAIDDAGGDVEFTGSNGGLTVGLQDADVLVVVDPAASYDADEVDEIESFVADGGRLLVVGEPNRKALQQTGLSSELVTRRSRVTAVASAFGVSFGTQYLYDMEANDGNFKNVLVRSPDRTDAAIVEGVDRVALYTAASVDVNRGTVLLRTARTAERGNEETRRGFPVAVRSANGRVVAVGDTTFLGEPYHSVADNDVFIQRLVEFMAAADRGPAGQGGTNESRRRPPGLASAP